MQLRDRVPVKRRWEKDEVCKMALAEARLVIAGDVNINQELMKILPGRSLDAIKEKRRPLIYKKTVEELIKVLRLEAPNQPPAATVADSMDEGKVAILEPGDAGEDEVNEADEDDMVPEDLLTDLMGVEDGKDEFNIQESTIIYDCVEKT